MFFYEINGMLFSHHRLFSEKKFRDLLWKIFDSLGNVDRDTVLSETNVKNLMITAGFKEAVLPENAKTILHNFYDRFGAGLSGWSFELEKIEFQRGDYVEIYNEIAPIIKIDKNINSATVVLQKRPAHSASNKVMVSTKNLKLHCSNPNGGN